MAQGTHVYTVDIAPPNTPTPSADPFYRDAVILYTGRNFTGVQQELVMEGEYNWCNQELAIGKDAIRSVMIPSGFEVTLVQYCDGGRPHGETEILTKSAPFLSKLDQQASVVIVKKAGGHGGSKAETQSSPYAQDGSHALFLTKPWYALGSEIKGRTPGERYMNDNAVRARAGLLHVTGWIVLIILLMAENASFLAYTVAPLALWEMVSAAIFGLTPLAPFGVIGTLLTWKQPPIWKPAGPKRFAWFLGSMMVTACIVISFFRVRPAAIAVAVGCITLTWLEASLGFCLGCWFWNVILVPLMGKKKCEECEMAVPLQATGPSRVSEVQDMVRRHPLVVFSKTICPHCKRAKKLLDELNAVYEVFELDSSADKDGYVLALVELTGRKTVPNVFVGGQTIGGADDTYALHDQGKLLPLLQQAGVQFRAVPSSGVATV